FSEERTERFERFAVASLVTQGIARLDKELLVDECKPTRAPHQVVVAAWTEIAQHGRAAWQTRIRQRAIVARLEEGKRQHAVSRQHAPQRTHQFNHLLLIDVRKNRKCKNEVELDAAIRNRLMTNAVRVVLRAVAIEVDEMRARISRPALFDHRGIDVDAPVILLVHASAGALQKRADVAAEIEYGAPLPLRTIEQPVEVTKLGDARR